MALFVIHRPDQGGPSPARTLSKTMPRVEARAKTLTVPIRVFERGEKDSTLRTFKRRKPAVGYAEKLLPKLAIGQVIEFQGASGEVVVRRVEKPKAELPAQAVHWPEVQKRIYIYVVTNFPQVRYAGTCNCRPTRQGGSLSDHACCHASDWFPRTKAEGDKLLDRLRYEFGGKILYVAWQVSLHYDHLHVATARCSDCF